jgi:hypothetical protein
LEILDLADFILEKVDGCNLFDERRDFFESNSKDYDVSSLNF